METNWEKVFDELAIKWAEYILYDDRKKGKNKNEKPKDSQVSDDQD